MKNVKTTPYTTPELEIITFECNDIVTTSVPVPDNNEDGPDW